MPEPVSALIVAPDVVPEISKVPLFTTPLEAAMLPAPDSASVPPPIVVAPVKPLTPDSVCAPPLTVRPPVPPIVPLNVPAAFASVSVRPPRATMPEPVNALMVAPEVVPEISNVPLFTTPLEAAMLPAPDNASVPALMVVLPA